MALKKNPLKPEKVWNVVTGSLIEACGGHKAMPAMMKAPPFHRGTTNTSQIVARKIRWLWASQSITRGTG